MCAVSNMVITANDMHSIQMSYWSINKVLLSTGVRIKANTFWNWKRLIVVYEINYFRSTVPRGRAGFRVNITNLWISG